MAPKYKLIYFNFAGRAEPIRMLLSYGGLEFEDNRFEREDWPKIKPTTPLGQVPVLEIDGKAYTQTSPICKYLGAVLNLNGKNPLEDLVIDAVLEVLWDLLKAAYEYLFETDETKKTQKLKKVQDLLPVILGKLEADTKNNNGYIALNRITWADVIFLGAYEDIMNLVGENSFDNFPHLKQLKDKLLKVQNLRNYIQKRPVNPTAKYDLKNEL